MSPAPYDRCHNKCRVSESSLIAVSIISGSLGTEVHPMAPLYKTLDVAGKVVLITG